MEYDCDCVCGVGLFVHKHFWLGRKIRKAMAEAMDTDNYNGIYTRTFISKVAISVYYCDAHVEIKPTMVKD